jgi:hypothetical protein
MARSALRVGAHVSTVRISFVEDTDIKRLETYLKRTFGNPHVAVKARPKQKDSAEVELSGEFIGVIYQDEDEDGSFMFEMAILAEDLT